MADSADRAPSSRRIMSRFTPVSLPVDPCLSGHVCAGQRRFAARTLADQGLAPVPVPASLVSMTASETRRLGRAGGAGRDVIGGH